MDEYTTTAKLTADVGQFITGFKSAQAEYKNFDSAMQKSTSSSDALKKSSTVVSSAMKIGAVAVAGLGVAAVKTGMDFEHQMSRVKAISGATGSEMKAMNSQAIQLGADTAFSAKQAAEGMENLASAGLKPKEIMEAMPGVLDLAAVSGGNVGDAANNAATALNGFGLSAGDASHVADVFARAAADTNAEASDMGEALSMVAPQAHAAGLSLEETSAAIGVLSDAGIKGSMAGSNLGMALTKVQNPSAEAKAAMEQLGFSAYDSAGKMKPLATQVSELKSKMAGMTDEQKAYNMSQIYGVQGGRAMNVLLGAQDGKLTKLTDSLKNSDGAAEEMAKTMQNDLSSSVEQFFGGLESLSIVIEQTFGTVLKGAVDGAGDAVGKLTKYLQDNQENIQKTTDKVVEVAKQFLQFAPSIDTVGVALKAVIPSFVAIETFKGIGVGGAKTTKALEAIAADLQLVKNGLTVTGGAATKAGSIIKLAFIKPLGAIKTSTSAVVNFSKQLATEKWSMVQSGLGKVGNSFKNLGGKAKDAGTSIVNNLILTQHPIKNTEAAFVSLGKKMSTSISGSVKNGLTPMLTALGMNSKEAIVLAGSLGTLIIPALAVAAVATAIYAAWNSNFMNIRGVVNTVISGIKGMFDSMKPSIDAINTALKPISGLLKDIFKIAGVAIIVALATAAVLLATALRLIVDALSAIANVVKAAFYGLEAFFQKLIPGGEDGAKAMKKAGSAMADAGTSVKDMGSAFKDAGKVATDSFGEFGKSAEKTKSSSKIASVSLKEVGNSAKQMKTDVEASKADFSKVIDTDGVSAKTKQFLTDVNSTLDQYQKDSEKASDNYSKAMTAAEDKKGAARLKAVNAANEQLAKATSKNGQDLINISSDLDRQLSAKKFTDGTAMTADQEKILTDQNLKIKAKLLEQNQIYTDAQLSRLKNGQKLNETDQQATITTLQSNYEMRAQQMTQGEQKIASLKQQIDQAKDTTTKAKLQQELAQQQNQNTQLLQQQTSFGQQMNMSIANGQKLNYTVWAQGLQNMKNVTAPELQSMFLSFVKMNTDTGQQMQAFALMLQQSGTKGVNNLVQALATGKATTKQITQALAKDGTDGLNSLPPSMFTKGKDGQAKFISALKSGNFKAAGKYLADQSSSGAKDTSKHKKSGKDNGDSYADGAKSSKSKAKSAGKEVAKSGSTGAKSEKSDYKSAGKSNGSSYTSGVKSETSSARSAGKSLANAAKSGAKGVSFNSVGSQMAAGVAAGIRSNTGAAVNAMANLVNQVNAQARRVAKIHSPSRMMRDDVGKWLSLGVAEGINDYQDNASNAMATMVGGLNKQAGSVDLSNSIDGQLSLQANHTVDMVATVEQGAVKPAVINLMMGNQTYTAFVDDISGQQDRKVQLKTAYSL